MDTRCAPPPPPHLQTSSWLAWRRVLFPPGQAPPLHSGSGYPHAVERRTTRTRQIPGPPQLPDVVYSFHHEELTTVHHLPGSANLQRQQVQEGGHPGCTNQQSFLHFSSCHPQNTFNTIVTGELLRALRCTSDVTIYLETVDRLISKFQERGYPRVLLREADKLNHGQRQGLLERKEKQQLQPDVTIFTTTHHPSLTSSAVRRVLSDEETPFRPMVVRRRAPSHKDRLVRARSDVIHNSSSTTCSYGRITPNNIS